MTVMLFAILLLSVPGGWAQNAEPQLSGRVVEAVNGEPIAGATVSLLPPFIAGPSLQSVKTDHEGYYSFPTVRQGGYSIHVSVDGFVDDDYKTDTMPDGAFLRFDSSTHFKGIDIQLTPEAIVRGAVTDLEGKPVANVTVSAVLERDAMKNHLAPTSATKTDPSGRFEIKKLSPGTYLVCASGPQGFGDPPYASRWYREKWFGNADSSDAATPIHLDKREVRSGVRITTSDEKRYRIIFWPSGPKNAPAPERYSVSILNRNTVEEHQKDGSWVIFDIPAGHYILASTAWSEAEYLGEGAQSVDVTNSDVTVRLDLGGLGDIAGVAQWLQGPKAIAHSALFMIESEEGAAQGVVVDTDGQFHITRVLPGRYIFKTFETHPPAIIKRVECRGRDINKSDPLSVGDREQVLGCKVTLEEPE